MKFSNVVKDLYLNNVDSEYKKLIDKECGIFWPYDLEKGVPYLNNLRQIGLNIKYVCNFGGDKRILMVYM